MMSDKEIIDQVINNLLNDEEFIRKVAEAVLDCPIRYEPKSNIWEADLGEWCNICQAVLPTGHIHVPNTKKDKK